MASGKSPAQTPKPSHGRSGPVDMWLQKEGSLQAVRAGRPDADRDYYKNLSHFRRTEISSREPNRKK